MDIYGVMRDYLEMAVDLDVPQPDITSTPGRTSSLAVLPLMEAAISDKLIMKAGELDHNNIDQDLNQRPSALQFEYSSDEDTLQQTNTSIEKVKEIASVNQFTLSKSFTLPVPLATLSPKELLKQQWIGELQQILLKIPQGLAPVSVVSADYKFREVLMNWFIAAMTLAHPPLTHIIVFSIDKPLCDLVRKRSINCIFVAPKDFLTQKAIAHLKKHSVFSEVMVLRLTAMRLMNHWGYDTANYDTDAIVLKSPESLYLKYSNSHLIGSHGGFPRDLGKLWGTTVCCGLFMTKSSPYTGMYEVLR